MAYKKYTLLLLGALALFVLVNLVIWKTTTEAILTKKFSGGDLARMGYLPGSKVPRLDSVDLPKRHLNLADYQGQPIDMITIGDSFSHGGAGGRNAYYQDYIATANNLTVLNISPYKDLDPITTVSLWLNNGYLDKVRPRIVLIETSEKFCAVDLAKPIDFDRTISPEALARHKKVDYYAEWPKIAPINSGNMKFVLNTLLYRFSDHAFSSEVYVGKLRQKLFTARDGERLLFLKFKNFATAEQVATLNDNFNTLAGRLQAKGITLYFMPVVDKYTLYSDYLLKKKHQSSSFFEEFRKLPKNYGFIDTKSILSDELKKGTQDIFYADDTHWGWKASELIFGNKRF